MFQFLGKMIMGITPLLIGGLIYIIYRVETLRMFNWFKTSYVMNALVTFLRENLTLKYIYFPNWVLFSLPDALWLFSFTYIILSLWDFKINKHSLWWVFIAPFIGIFSELGQLIKMVPGTFDIIDLALLTISAILPFLNNIFFKSIKL